MQNRLRFAALLLALAIASPSYAVDILRLFGIRSAAAPVCGGGCCEPACGCATGCEPACGCAAGACLDGRQFAGQCWDGCCESGPRLCPCTGPAGRCEPSCGCAPVGGCADACEPGCGCEPVCGCGVADCGPRGACAGGPCVGKDWFGCGVFRAIGNCLCGCSGCDSEFYWSEWHNDPPRCCDPCDRCGNWTGPGAGYQAPYAHAYSPSRSAAGPYYVGQAGTQNPPTNQQPAGRVVRKPNISPARTYQR